KNLASFHKVDCRSGGFSRKPFNFKAPRMVWGLRNEAGREDPMKTNLFNLIVMSPMSPRIHKIKVSRKLLVILFVTFLVSFGITVALLSSFSPEKLSDENHRRLAAENQALLIENRNIELRADRIANELKEIEELSNKINSLMAAD